VAQSIGELLRTAEAGDSAASDALFAALYAELHTIAERQLHRGGSELTLGTTTLLHEAYLNISGREGLEFATRGQFLAYAARAMRGLMLDYARRRRTRKRGGEFHITASGAEPAAADDGSAEAMDRLGEALIQLADVDPALAQLVDLHFFSGFTFTEVAELRGVSERTVQRDWRKARLLLHRTIRDD
jgi:RNA polymerase sigma factor (TIGR02999 family)